MIDVQGFPTRILIVDDRAGTRESLARVFRYAEPSFIVATASSGEQALECLAREPFDVVLCDLVLGGELDGVAVTRAIRDEHPGVRIVVFTGQETGESKEEVLQAGAFAYLSKPVPHSELIHAIKTINSIRRTERLHSWFETLTKISYDLQASFDFDTLARRIVNGLCELGYSRARLYMFDEEHKVLMGKESAGMRDGFAFDPEGIPLEAWPIVRQIFQADRPILWNRALIVERFGAERTEPWLIELELEEITWVDCPLLVRNQRIGTLAADHLLRPDYRYTEDDRQILTFFSGLAAQALNNSRLYEQEAIAKASLQLILEKAPDAVVTTDLDGTINIVSPSSERVLGFSHQEMQGKKAAEFYTDEQLTAGSGSALAKEIMSELGRAEGEMLSNRRVFLRGKGGGPRPILLSVSMLHDDDDNAIGTLGILKDLGPLEEQTRHYQDVLEAFGYGTLLLTEKGEITFVNRKAERLLGRQRSDLLNQGFPGLVNPAQVSEVNACLKRLHGGKDMEEVLELTLVQPTGRWLPVTATFTLAAGKRRRGKTIAVALADKSEQGQLMQSQRLMALGELVAGIAHEVNNPLNLILPAAQDAKRTVERRGWSDDDLDEDLEIIATGGRRIRDIVRQLRDFARPSDFYPVPLSVNQLVEESLIFFATRFRNNDIELKLDLDPELPVALADGKRLRQVLLNLVFNADQAMETTPGAKRVRIETRRGEPGFVLVSVADNGPGIPEELWESIFDPFFTTKQGQGTGLGLSVSRSIINLHRGRIYARHAERGSGAKICIELPIAEQTEAA